MITLSQKYLCEVTNAPVEQFSPVPYKQTLVGFELIDVATGTITHHTLENSDEAD